MTIKTAEEALAGTPQRLNIYQRIALIRDDVAYLKKDKAVQVKTKSGGTFSYQAITHDAVAAAIREPMSKHGVVSLPTMEECTINNGPVSTATVKVCVLFICTDNPDDRTATIVYAQGADMGDKSPGKAFSYACKMAYLKVFNIETGDSDESREETKAAHEPVSARQFTVLNNLLEETETDQAAFVKALQAKNIEVVNLMDLPANRFELASGMLQAKKAKLKKGDK